jgi:acyl transferase domain-containing protein/acyl carrier protein/NAD(P)-dependent dehydrogenase (short-subunit alcohol dehydrogenase family)/1,4-dihydroxy-2-naphthoyl-CoA synthase/SAM-dependent methyltransferase
MPKPLRKRFKRCAAMMRRQGLTRLAGDMAGHDGKSRKSLDKLRQAMLSEDVALDHCLLLAAAIGLLPEMQPPPDLADDAARKQHLWQSLTLRDHVIRPARRKDLPALLRLEQFCWAPALRSSEAILANRIATNPGGQLVLLVGDELVGVIYSQMIAGPDALVGATAQDIDARADKTGRVVQLLAVNILPEVQQRNLGDQLLEFMLIYRSLQRQVDSVLAVTLCRHFNRANGIDFETYIQQRNAQGVLADPILRFHELHGATIEGAVPGYRPADLANAGNGVLVHYDIRRRRRTDLRVEPTASWRSPADSRASVLASIRDILRPDRVMAFAADRPLMEMGLDSADLLDLNERLAASHGVTLGPAFFFQFNTADKIATYLDTRLAASTAIIEQAEQPHRASYRAEDIAVIGMACRLPGGIDSPEEFWACLREGRSVIGALPEGRWQWPAGIDPDGRHRGIDRGGFLDDVAMFDAAFFRISPAEAESMDPQQRILLELCWQTIEHAGYAADALAGSRTGVFIGASGSDYARLLDQAGGDAGAHYGTGSAMAVLANRISYFHDFHGPSLVLDTACSSSLVALHEALQSLMRGESDQALVGGINLILHPANSIAYCKAGMLSPDGLCQTFDRAANGYVRSEGAVVLLLKPLQKALADKDVVHAVIKGSACNHGGLASGLTVPNPAVQGQLLQAAWRAAAIDPRDLGYLEAHGTGTALGDPVEIAGIALAFAEAAPAPGGTPPRGLGSVKTNLGHLEAAAGLAGVLKSILCLQHRQLVPSLNFRNLNPHMTLAGTGCEILVQLQDWAPPTSGGPRLAGVSSFGSGGTNAHAVIAEATPQEDIAAVTDAGPVLFVLSARTLPQLLAYAQTYVGWLDSAAGRAVPLPILCHQLQRGRRAMASRLAFVAADRADLVRQLRAYCAAPAQTPESDRRWPDLALTAQSWRAGSKVDWSCHSATWPQGRPQRVVMPTYPFARQHHWLPKAEIGAMPVATGTPTAAATLLAPVWRPIPPADLLVGDSVLPRDASLLLVSDSDRYLPEIEALHPNVHWLQITGSATIETLVVALKDFATIDHVLWLAPEAQGEPIGRQECGLLHVFKLVKALLSLGYGTRVIAWTLMTRETQSVYPGAETDPADAGIHGLVGVLAKEFPRWPIRALDLQRGVALPVQEALRMPVDAAGDVIAHRHGQWLRRRFARVSSLPEAPIAYRQNGTYVVIGGAGGIGEAWSRHVIAQFQAQVIWIGRRPANQIAAMLATFADLGPVPVYIQADASDFASLQAAHAEITRRWPVLDGVIHAAVGPFDRSLHETDEASFRTILAAKIAASQHVARIFGQAPLDFLVYFSSVVALEKNGGYGGYAAGGAFQDAFALHLAQVNDVPVKVMNWGHWQIGTGALIADTVKRRLQRSGQVAIEAAEGMAALQSLLTAPIPQLALVKTARPEALPFFDGSVEVECYPATIPLSRMAIPSPARMDAEAEALQPRSLFKNAELESLLAPLCAAILRELGLHNKAATQKLAGHYRPWLMASLNWLAARNCLPADATATPAAAWAAWQGAKRGGALADPNLRPAIDLVETCLQALPEILAGRRRATDVIFPGASMRRVEGIYRDNSVADHFNRVMVDSLVAMIEARLLVEPDARLRLLEVGAGTGGTTAMLLPRLAAYRDRIAEYAYTDVSKAFLFHAETQFMPAYPFVQAKLFDVERPLAEQNLIAGSYDIVIATNVLHATRDIRITLANCKAALRKGGLLLLNEISTPSLFAHLTFGLLEGWWLAEDQVLRMPDSPGLDPVMWRAVLALEGFAETTFPAPQSHRLGQQIIAATSDGIVRQARISEGSAGKTVLRVSAKPASPAEEGSLRAAAHRLLTQVVAKTLRMNSADVDLREPLEAYGIDSILVVQITEALREIFPDISSTLLFECQTIEAMGAHLLAHHRERLIAHTGIAAPTVTRPEPKRESTITPDRRQGRSLAEPTQDAIAVIGMSCRFPQAPNIDAYWQVLQSGRSCIGEIPPDRWPIADFFAPDPDEAVAQGKSYSKWGAFLDGVTEFDPLFFNISPKEAVAIDPQERLFLQTAWEALEDAGYTRARLADEHQQQLGVFVGITRTGFDLFGPELWARGETLYPHTSFSSVANRLSYYLNARGPSVPVDTMCSSSLTAIHQACQSLRNGECALAIAGGVNVYLHPSGYVGLSAARMLSPDGVCRSFGAGANGFVPGEGVAAILLKPLAQAIADGDQIQAVIRATNVNHGGKTNGYTVPNPQAQAALVKMALEKAGVDARAVSYIEAHGTGTELGDPIEIAALTEAFRHFTPDHGFCALGSAKSNIGHLEASAGIAGFIKVVLQMRHRQIVPSLHATALNPRIDFAATPFVLQQHLGTWHRPILADGGEAPRLAGISSFGAGGANAHVVVEEYVDGRVPAPALNRDQAIVLSARNADRLKAYAARLNDFLGRSKGLEVPALADIAYTLQAGREQMEQRLGLVVRSVAELQEKLAAFATGQSGQDGVHTGIHTGNARDHKDIIAPFVEDDSIQDTLALWFQRGEFARLLGLWSKGLNIDWRYLHHRAADAGAIQPRSISLPTYPFATARYWLPLQQTIAVTRTLPADMPAPRIEAPLAAVASRPRLALRDPATVTTTFAAAGTLRPQALLPLQQSDSPALPARRGQFEIAEIDDGVLMLRPEAGSAGMLDVSALTAGIAATTQMKSARVLLLTGLDRLRDSDARQSLPEAVAAITGSKAIVIALLTGDNGYEAMVLAAASEVMICALEGSYSVHAAQHSVEMDRLLRSRFAGLSESAAPLRIDDLRRAGLALAAPPAREADAFALETARHIARAPAPALQALKRHLSQLAIGTVQDLVLGAPSDPTTTAAAAQSVALASMVVSLTAYDDGVVVLTLCDRASKNTFSSAFVDGVIEAFTHIAANPDYKVVVLTGYDNYFACGGTKDGLLAIQAGAARFTDEQSYAMPLACEIPVIAAMQGHGIGAGWAMGLFCDHTIYSEESVYQSPYLLYGFTPGAGATLIFPAMLGQDLGREVLLTARAFPGRELRQRGLRMPVLPRGEVLPRALALARQLARSDRADLIREKTARRRFLREELPKVFAQELALHDQTFVGNAEVAGRIARHFQAMGDEETPALKAARAPAANASGLKVALRQSLAEELHLSPAEIADSAPFIDLGMDSISAVTWIRKINREFDLSLAATRIYSHPTLERFAELVQSLKPDVPTIKVGQTTPPANDELMTWLRSSLGEELSIPVLELDAEAKFIDLGLDSIAAVTWIRAINARYGLQVAATRIYSHPTLSSFHAYLAGLGAVTPTAQSAKKNAAATFEQPRPPAPKPPESPGPSAALPVEPAAQPTAPPAIAIIGMAGQFPKAADVRQFWRNLVAGRDCVSEIPAALWSVESYFDPDRNAPGKTVCRHMGVLEDRDLFDPLLFNISPSEAELMDPQQRLFLENSWRCIEDAGYDPADLAGTSCGVFVGCAVSDYGTLLAGQPASAQALMGESVAMLPARIAYFLDLQGPCLAIDTACSASLVAIASACDSLTLGNSDVALAGGVYIINGPDIHVKMSKAGMLSPDGRCFSFDQRANGFVPGEGVAVVMLKRLSDAERDGDDIYGVIRGWGVNQDGKTNGITAPNQEAQARLESAVYRKFAIDPADIQLVEAHGTGTRLGDPIEVEALCQSFRQFTDRQRFCALGSVKSNIGHLATAAGVTGVIKAALSLQHGYLPPTIHFGSLNEHIDLGQSPFYVNAEGRSWPTMPPKTRLAAVSSFGFSGTNAHLVMSGWERSAATAVASGPVLVPLSARSEAQLFRYAQAILDYLADAEVQEPAINLADLAYTFQTGRPEMPCRLAIIAADAGELRRHLVDVIGSGVAGIVAGNAAPLIDTARRWVAGARVNWDQLHRPGSVRRRHGLPTYPFAHERYWAPLPDSTAAEVGVTDQSEPLPPTGWQSVDAPVVDWQTALRHQLAQRILVVHADDTMATAFAALLAQLQRAGDIAATVDIAYSRIEDAAEAPDFDCLILLAREDRVAATATWLQQAGLAGTVIASLTADLATVETLGDRLAEATFGQSLLVGTAPGAGAEIALQHLFREWLAWPELAGDVPHGTIYYEGARRLARRGGVARRPERICLVDKIWRQKPAETPSQPSPHGTLLILANGWTRQWAESLIDPVAFRGVVIVTDLGGVPVQGEVSVDFANAEAARVSAAALVERHGGITHLLDLTDLLEAPTENAGDCAGKAAFYQVLVASCGDLSLIYLTKGLQHFRTARMSLAGAGFAGLVRMLSAEYPHIQARFVDIDQAALADLPQLKRMLMLEMDAILQEPELCYRADQRFVPHLVQRPLDEATLPPPIDEEGVYVVSGGTNGVGLEIARHLADKGCTKLVLMGVTPLPPKAQWAKAVAQEDLSPYIRDKLVALLALDRQVPQLEVYTGPLSAQHALRRYFVKIRATLGPIRGVIHAAAVYSEAAKPGFAQKDLAQMQSVWEAKAVGLENLHAVFKADQLDFFVSFASMTGLVPHLARGAADYAMANAFVEFFATYQRRQSGNGYKAILWSDWHETGAITRISADRAASVRQTFDRIGLRTFSNAEGRTLFDLALASEAGASVVIGYLDQARFERVRPQLLLARPDLQAPARSAPPVMAAANRPDMLVTHIDRWEVEHRLGRAITIERVMAVVGLEDIRQLPPALIHRLHRLLFGAVSAVAPGAAINYPDVIAATVREVLKLKTIDPAQPFQNYGLDSISAMVLATRLEKKLGREILPQWLIESPTVEKLAHYLAAEDHTSLSPAM